jgi:uncharacterized protein
VKTLLAAAAIAAALAGTAHAEPTGPSFNCVYAKMSDEVIICQDAELSAKDRQMAGLYSDTMNLFRGGFRDYVRRTQVDWLGARRFCHYSAGCVGKAYDYRITTLMEGDVELAEWCRAGHMRDVDCRDHVYEHGVR